MQNIDLSNIEPQKRTRIKDIAQKAKVSTGTVDRVLHGRGEVSAKTREKVLSILEEMDYKPNILASTLASQKEHHFAVLIPESQDEESYWNKPLTGINRAFSDLIEYGVRIKTYMFSPSNPDSFNAKTGEILETPIEGVIMAPFFIKESKSFIEKLDEKNIPYVFIDSNLKETNQISYIGQNSFQCGSLAARLFDLIIHGQGNILVVHMAKKMDNQNHLIQREKGFYDYFTVNSNHKKQLTTIEIEDDAEEKLYSCMDNHLKEIGIIDGIFVTNSKVHLIAEYIKKRNISSIHLIGHDLIIQNVKWLKEGVVDFLICQRPEEQGYNAVDALFNHVLLKKQVEKENYTSIDIITKENIDFYK